MYMKSGEMICIKCWHASIINLNLYIEAPKFKSYSLTNVVLCYSMNLLNQ